MNGKGLKGTSCEKFEGILSAFRKEKKEKRKQEEFQALHVQMWPIYRLRDYVPNKGINYPDTQLPGAEYLCNNSKLSYGVYGRKMDLFKASVKRNVVHVFCFNVISL